MNVKFILIISLFLIFSCKEKFVESQPSFPIEPIGGFRLEDFDPSWSPDGKTIAYVHGDTVLGLTGIYLIDTNGQNNKLLFSSPRAWSPTWDPTGQWIAFTNFKEIFIIKKDGSNLTQLTFHYDNHFPSWSPNGQLIAYDNTDCGTIIVPPPTNRCGIMVMKPDGLEQKLTLHGRFPSFINDSTIMYIGYLREIYISSIYDSITRKITYFNNTNTYSRENLLPKYSKANNQIIFTSQPYATVPQICKIDMDGNNFTQITNTQGYTCDWSPDGKLIVYTDSSPDSGALWIMDKNGNNKKKLKK